MQIGIIGLPNVGKSTLFNALLKKQVALAANYPFATIEPNIGIVDVPDSRLDKISELITPEKTIPAVVKFVDIAGLVKGASEGEGLGNKFLAHVREVDALVHVLRDFEDENIARAGSIDPLSDMGTINTELMLADVQVLEKRLESEEKRTRTGDKDVFEKIKVYEKLYKVLSDGEPTQSVDLSDEEKMLIKDLNLLTMKPVIQVYNVDEKDLVKANSEGADTNVVHLCAKLEVELAQLSDEEQQEYMKELGIRESGLDKVIKRGYDLLDLQTYFTAGVQEVRAWTITKGSKAPEAAGKIHTDMQKGFIMAEVMAYEDFVAGCSKHAVKEKGLLRMEGRDYTVKDGDIVEFRFNV